MIPTRKLTRTIPCLLLAVAALLTPACVSTLDQPLSDSVGAFPDYRNGWYHWTDGVESVREVAARYQRDPALTAELNRTRPELVPIPNTALYIPPVHDRALLRQILTRINTNPASVPTRPPTAAEFLSADQMMAAILQPTPAPTPAMAAPVFTPVPPEPVAAAQPTPAPTPIPTPVVSAATPPAPNAAATPAASDPAFTDPSAQPLLPPPVPTKVYTLEEARKRHDAERAAARTVTVKSGQFNWPVQGNLLRQFAADGPAAFHGVAIEAVDGTQVLASREGRVIFAGDVEGYGKVVILDHGAGMTTVYGYASRLLARTGRQVAAGEPVALSGRPSATSPGQVFFQIRHNGQPVNPLDHVR